MKKLAKFLLESIVDSPEKIKINQKKEEDSSLTLNLKVSREDIGKVIGRKGKTIKAITNLIRIKAIREGKKVDLNVEENKE